jgi:outer membrane protein assembly factor BamB
MIKLPQPAPDTSVGGFSTAIWQNLVLASCEDGRIYALDRSTGAVVWLLPGVGQRPPGTGLQPDVRLDSRVLVVVGNTLFAGSESEWVIAYDLPTHRELWRETAGEGSVNDAPIVSDGNAVYVVYLGGALAAFSTTEPKTLWQTGGLPNGYFGTVALGPDRVFASGGEGFTALAKSP